MSDPEKRTGLFRERAIAKLASPEQIDKLLIVMTPKGWIALLTLFALIIAALIWSFVGQIPISIQGKGIILTSKGLFNIVTPSSGIVQSIGIKHGDFVEIGSPIATVNGTQVSSLSSGRVLEVYVKEGDWVDVGKPLAWVEHPQSEDDPYICLAYFNVSQGEKIESGMEAKIALENIDVATYGYLLGRVDAVSTFPVAERSMINRLRNPGIVALLKQENKTVIQCEICLEQDEKSPSGYRFTTKASPPKERIVSGTICDVRIITETKTPISYLFPSLSSLKSHKPRPAA